MFFSDIDDRIILKKCFVYVFANNLQGRKQFLYGFVQKI